MPAFNHAQVGVGNIELAAGAIVERYEAHAYVKTGWHESETSWTHIPFLKPISLTERAIPARSEARFYVDYGVLADQFSINATPLAPYVALANLFVHDLFVAIRIMPETSDPFGLWAGILPAVSHNIHGRINDVLLGKVATGRQLYTAAGFEFVLDRRRVDGVYGADGDGVRFKFGERFGFNDRFEVGLGHIGNRSAQLMVGIAEQSYGFGFEFEGFPSTPIRWGDRDILDYQLYNSDEDAEDALAHGPHFRLVGPADLLAFLDASHQVMPSTRTTWEVIKKIIRPERGIGARFVWGTDNDGLPDGSTIEIVLHSTTDEEVIVGDKVLPLNPNTANVFAGTSLGLKRVVYRRDVMPVYDRVRVWGGATISCFTLSDANETKYADFALGWPADLETDYLAAEEAERLTDIYATVFRLFGVLTGFNWRQPAGETGDPTTPLNPSYDALGHVQIGTTPEVEAAFFNHPRLRFLPTLPLNHPADIVSEFKELRPQKPFAVVELEDEDGDGTGKFVFVEQNDLDDAGNKLPHAPFKVLDRGMKFEIRFSPAYLFALNQSTGLENAVTSPKLDFAKMRVTVAVKTNTLPKVEVTTKAWQALPSRPKQRVIDLEDKDVHVHIVAPGTVVGLKSDGSLRLHVGGPVIRDDTDRLRAIAALASSFYGKERSVLEFEEHGLYDHFGLGTMILELDDGDGRFDVGTPVTERQYDFEAKITKIKTGAIALQVVRKGGGGIKRGVR